MTDKKTGRTHQDLKDEFEGKVEDLREECDHPEVSGWQEEWWAPGHSTGFEVKTCKVCGKIVARRTRCARCGKLIEEKDFNRGKGDKRPVSEIFCSECQEEWERFVQDHPYNPSSETSTRVVERGLEFVGSEEDMGKNVHYMRLHERFLKQVSTGGIQ